VLEQAGCRLDSLSEAMTSSRRLVSPATEASP
jgi:hypothetical protein